MRHEDPRPADGAGYRRAPADDAEVGMSDARPSSGDEHGTHTTDPRPAQERLMDREALLAENRALRVERDRARAKCEVEQSEKREARGEREFFKLVLEAVFDCLHWNAAGRRWLIKAGGSQRFTEAVEAARIALLGVPPAHGRDLAAIIRRLGKYPPKEDKP